MTMCRHPRLTFLSLLLLLLPTYGRVTEGAPRPPALIPRSALFSNPVRTAPLVSPDGRQLAYLAPDDKGVMNIWVRAVGQPQGRLLTRLDRAPSYGRFFWQYDSQHIIYYADRNGDENTHLYQVKLLTAATRDLTPYDGIAAEVIALSPDHPDHMLVAMNLRRPELHDVYRINLRTGEAVLDTENPGDVDAYLWRVDSSFRVRAAMGLMADGGAEIRTREDERSPWRVVQRWGPDDNGVLDNGIIGFTPDDRGLYLTSSVGVNAACLVRLDLRTGHSTVLAQDVEYDAEMDTALLHPRTRALEAIRFYRTRGEWRVLAPSLKADFAALRRVRDGDFHITSRDMTGRTWIVSYTVDNGPLYFYVYDRASKKASLLFSDRPALEKYQLATMRPFSFKARDGMTIHGYLTLPVGVRPLNLPTVVYVHGGPWMRDIWGFNKYVQWMANRGYAVLQVNFRGSSGYGKAYLNAGDREWGGKMNTDLIDGKNWAVKQGYTDPKRVGIFGYSYGGYAVLAALAFTPDEFACGIDMYGPSNLVAMIKADPAYYKVVRSIFDKRMGNADTEAEFLLSRSPISKVGEIKAPLLIAQGANDVRVTPAESDRIADALKARGTPVEYLLFSDEGHGGWRAENTLKFVVAAERFLAKHLGGRFEQEGSN